MRETVDSLLACYKSTCPYICQLSHQMENHVTKEHNGVKKITAETVLFPSLLTTSLLLPSDETSFLLDPASSHLLASPSEDSPMPRHSKSHSSVRTCPYLRISPSPNHTRLSADLADGSPVLAQLNSPAQCSPLKQIGFSNTGTSSNEPTSTPMDVDEDHNVSLSHISLSVLNVFPCPQFLACTQCLCGIPPLSVLEHAASHGIKTTLAQKHSLKEWMSTTTLAQASEDLQTPTPNSALIDGLNISNGHACTLCTFCAGQPYTMQKHISSKHPDRKGPWQENCKEASVQAYF